MTLKFTAIVGFCLALAACGGSGSGGGGAGAFAGAGSASAVSSASSLQAPDSDPVGGLAASAASSQLAGDPASLATRAALGFKRQLLPSQWGVGFASVPGTAVLTKTLQVADSREGALPWTATASASWLTVTGSGTTGTGPGLVLTANPQLAPLGAVSQATVTLRTSDPGVEAAVIQVGLWRSDEGLTAITALPADYTQVVADRIRPYVYAHNGGTFIDVYNAHLGTKVGTIPDAGAALSGMTVSPDGSLLYVLDRDAQSEYLPGKSIVVVDLASLSKIDTWPLKAQVPGVSVGAARTLLAIRTNGKNIVLASDGDAYVDGRQTATLSTYAHWDFAASSDGRKVFAQNNGLSPATARAYDIGYRSMSDATAALTTRLVADVWGVSRTDGRDIATNADGTAVYINAGWNCVALNPANLAFVATLAIPGTDFASNNAEVTTDGRVLCGSDGMYSSADIWVYAPDRTPLKSFKFASYAKGLLERQLVVTPDGTMAVGLTNEPRMAFVPLGTP